MMEKVNNLLKNGGEVRLPPGFRFHPTDEELVVQYLRRKVFSSPLPAAIIPEVDLSNSDPWDLPGDLEQERYFFSTKEAKYPNGNRSNRATNSGYWKATGLDKQILTSKGANHHVVGMKKTLVFYRGKPPHGSRTDWIMHEYRLHTQPPTSSPLPSPSQKQKERRVENWVLCRIFLKRRGGAKNGGEEAAAAATETLRPSVDNKARNSKPKVVVFYDFLAHSKDNTPAAAAAAAAASSSSDTSGITELSTTNEIEIQWNNNNNEHEDTTSSSKTFPSFTREP